MCYQNFVVFYESPPLSNGPHTLVITNLNANASYYLDYLKVTMPALASSTTVTTMTMTMMTTSTAFSAATSLPAESSSTGSKASEPGVIAAISLGGVFVLAVFLMGALWWRRRRHRSSYSKVWGSGK